MLIELKYLRFVQFGVLLSVKMEMRPPDLVAQECVLHILISDIAVVPYHSVVVDGVIVVSLADLPDL